jgi:DNA-binding transcriptional LysR family regulator
MDDPGSELPWEDVRFFLAAARHGSLGKAARASGTQQSTLSRRVAALERRLGGALFDRTRSGLALTRLGAVVLREARGMEQASGRLADAVSRELREVEGVVRIALTETMACAVVIPRVLPALLARHPGLRVDLVTGGASVDLVRREADVAVRHVRTPAGDLVSRRVAQLATAPLAHRRLARALARLEPSRWPWVSTWLPGDAGPTGGGPQALARTTPPRVTSNSYHAQWEAVRAGLAVGVLPTALARLDRALCVLDCALPPPPPLDVFLVTRRTARNLPGVSAVWQALAEGLGALG